MTSDKIIADITPKHFDQILKINAEFVHWLAPLDRDELIYILSKANYAKQINNAQAILIGYGSDTDYPEHENLAWLRARFNNFFYIDRIIIDPASQGRGLAKTFYQDFEIHARNAGYTALTCEVNTLPDNPRSHQFHEAFGFHACGNRDIPNNGKALRYYHKPLF